MTPERQRDPRSSLVGGITIPTLLLVGLTAAIGLRPDTSLRSVRPQDQAEVQHEEERRLKAPPPLHAVYARLWEDPYAVAKQDSVSKGAASQSNMGTNPSREDLLQWRDQSRKLQRFFGDLAEQHPLGKSNRLLLLPVMIPGSPYSEDAEQRKRTRYAVVSALGRAGYQLSYPTRVSYVKFPIDVTFSAGRRYGIRELVMPVKLYQPRRGVRATYGKVLVCWINEDAVGDDPIDVLEQIAESLFGNQLTAIARYASAWTLPGIPARVREAARSPIDLKVLGPANSDSLRKILRPPSRLEAGKPRPRPSLAFLGGASPEVLVVRATVQDTDRPPTPEPSFGDPKAKRQPDHAPFLLRRIIGTDRVLADAIVNELEIRGVMPSNRNMAVLLTERDSLYGTAFPETFGKAVDAHWGFTPQTNGVSDFTKRQVRTITYLRGLDGMALVKNGDQQKLDEIDRPEGRSQYDYVRRIREQIASLERAAAGQSPDCQSLFTPPAVRAIGVVGSDVYDKLLLLRSLRSHFPNVVFFTTDLDAAYSYRTEYPHTRNLLVASHFALSLHPDLQGDVLPFRGSYQTSTFLGTLAAVEFPKVKASLVRGPPPLLFEIGRNGPYQLTHTGGKPGVHPLGGQERQLAPLIVLGWIGAVAWLGLVVAFQFDRPRRGLLDVIDAGSNHLVVAGIVVCSPLLILFLSERGWQRTLLLDRGDQRLARYPNYHGCRHVLSDDPQETVCRVARWVPLCF